MPRTMKVLGPVGSAGLVLNLSFFSPGARAARNQGGAASTPGPHRMHADPRNKGGS